MASAHRMLVKAGFDCLQFSAFTNADGFLIPGYRVYTDGECVIVINEYNDMVSITMRDFEFERWMAGMRI